MRSARLEIAASVKRAMLGEEPGRARPPKVRSGAVFGKRETLPYNTCDVHNAKLVQHVVNLLCYIGNTSSTFFGGIIFKSILNFKLK